MPFTIEIYSGLSFIFLNKLLTKVLIIDTDRLIEAMGIKNREF